MKYERIIHGLRDIMQRRTENRISIASQVADSRIVSSLMDHLSQIDPDATVTVTQPKDHPFTRITVQATWGVTEHQATVHHVYSSGMHLFPDRSVSCPTVTWTGDQVAIKPVIRRGKVIGARVISKYGGAFLPNDASSTFIANTISTAVRNPRRIVQSFEPGKQDHQRIINR